MKGHAIANRMKAIPRGVVIASLLSEAIISAEINNPVPSASNIGNRYILVSFKYSCWNTF